MVSSKLHLLFRVCVFLQLISRLLRLFEENFILIFFKLFFASLVCSFLVVVLFVNTRPGPKANAPKPKHKRCESKYTKLGRRGLQRATRASEGFRESIYRESIKREDQDESIKTREEYRERERERESERK